MPSYSGVKSLGKSYSPMAVAIYTSILTVPIVGCSDDSDSSGGDPSTAITLSNETISFPGTHFVLVTNTAGYDIRILSFTVNSLPEGVMLDSEKNRCESIVLKAGESCTFSYSVSENAYGEAERPITIEYAAADFGPVYSTDDQATIPTLAVDGVSLVFENGDFVVKRASMSGPESTDVEIKNLGPFAWQLEVDASIFSIGKSSENGAEPTGLSVQAGTTNSCIGEGVVPVGSSCFVSVQSTDESVDDTAQYVLKIDAEDSRNVASDISRNFPLLNDGSVTAAVSVDDGTVYPAIRAIKIANTINFSATIMARIDSESFEVYDQNPAQLWCNDDWCRDSCYTQEHPFVYPESRSMEIDAISGQTAGSCYVYLRPKGIAVAESREANLSISDSRSDVTREFLVSGKGVLFTGGYFTDGTGEMAESFVAQYDGSWSKSTPEIGALDAFARLAIDGQGRLYLRQGPEGDAYFGRLDADGWTHLEPNRFLNGTRGFIEPTIASDSGTLYAAGYFDAEAVGDEKVIGKFDGSNWDAAFLQETRTQFSDADIMSLALDNNENLYVLGGIGTYDRFIKRYDSDTNQWSDLAISDPGGYFSALVIDQLGDIYTSGYMDGTGTQVFVSQYNSSDGSWDSLEYPVEGGYTVKPDSLFADKEGNLYLSGRDLLVYSASEKSWSSIGLTDMDLRRPIDLMTADDAGNIYVGSGIAESFFTYGVRGYSKTTMQWDSAGSGASGEVFNDAISDFATSNLIDIKAQ